MMIAQDDSIQADFSGYRGFVVTANGQYFVQRPDDNQYGFTIYGENTRYYGGMTLGPLTKVETDDVPHGIQDLFEETLHAETVPEYASVPVPNDKDTYTLSVGQATLFIDHITAYSWYACKEIYRKLYSKYLPSSKNWIDIQVSNEEKCDEDTMGLTEEQVYELEAIALQEEEWAKAHPKVK